MSELDLTFPERKVLIAIATGNSPIQITKSEGLDGKTLQWITASIYFKLGVNSRPAAVAQAFLKGYLVFQDVPIKPARKEMPLTAAERKCLIEVATDKLPPRQAQNILHSLFNKLGATGGRADAVAQACVKGILKKSDIPVTRARQYKGRLRSISPSEQIALSLRRDGFSPQESSKIMKIMGIPNNQVTAKLNAAKKKLSADSIEEAVIIAERLELLIDIEHDTVS